MPRLARVCSEPGCSQLVPCSSHPRKTWSQGSAASRGYGAEHARCRRVILQAGTPCAVCQRPASILDHVIPLAEGGRSERANYQPLCVRCSRAKTRSEQQRGIERAKARRQRAAGGVA